MGASASSSVSTSSSSAAALGAENRAGGVAGAGAGAGASARAGEAAVPSLVRWFANSGVKPTDRQLQQTTDALLERVLPEHTGSIRMSIDHSLPSSRGVDGVVLDSSKPHRAIRASDAATAFASLGSMLLREVNVGPPAWSGTYAEDVLSGRTTRRVDLSPGSSTPVDVIHSLEVPIVYDLNVVTSSYSMALWDWERWERELDRMALSGINTALAPVGQEALMRRVYRNLFGEKIIEEVAAWQTGEAYLAWHRMGNLQRVGGPISEAWLDEQVALQHRILDRMADLGIRPILPAFNGFCPPAFKAMEGGEDLHHVPTWFGFSERDSGLLHGPISNSLLASIGEEFVRAQQEEYAAELSRFSGPHLYSVDTWNEQDPPASLDLRADAAATFRAMQAGDKDAVWVMQSWFATHHPRFWTADRFAAYLSGVPPGRLLLLDLHGEHGTIFDRYSKPLTDLQIPIVFCMLHNFGGTVGLGGELAHSVASFETFARNAKKLAAGVGLSMEGIEQNEFIYDAFLHLTVFTSPMLKLKGRLSKYISLWVSARYGSSVDLSAAAAAVWQRLADTVYARPPAEGGYGNPASVIEKRPWFRMRKPSFQPTDITYAPHVMVESLKALLKAAAASTASPDELSSGFLFDIVDFSRQVLADHTLGELLERQLMSAVSAQDAVKVAAARDAILGVIDVLEELLSAHPHWRLDHNWMRFASTKPQAAQLATLITSWDVDGHIPDYASRCWGGVVGGVYRRRWDSFLTAALAAVTEGRKLDRAFHSNLQRGYLRLEREWVEEVSEAAVAAAPTPLRPDGAAIIGLAETVLRVVGDSA